jgi:NitT/TauT family transport system permease protein
LTAKAVAELAAWHRTESFKRWQQPATLAAPFLIVLAAWYLLTGNPPLVGREFLPSPNTVGRAFVALLTQEFLVNHLLPSVLRVSAAFLLAVAIAFPLGVLAGQRRWVAQLVEPLCGFTRYLPVAALVPLCILWFGIDDGQKVAVIVLGVVFQLVLLFAADTASVPQELVEAGRTFGLTSRQIVTRIVVPWSLPAIWNDMRIAAGWAWSYLVLAELVAGSSGVGYFVVQSQRFLRTDRVFAGILFIGILGLITDFAFRAGARRLFKWQ